MLVQLIPNFLSKEKCQQLIQTLCNRQNETSLWRDTIVLHSFLDDEISYKLTKLSEENNLVVNYYQIVCWPSGSYQDSHVDGTQTKINKYTSILYLNDDYIGGETFIENIIVRPKTGTLLFFKGSEYCHGVNKITTGTRYTVPCWYGYKELKNENTHRSTQG